MLELFPDVRLGILGSQLTMQYLNAAKQYLKHPTANPLYYVTQTLANEGEGLCV